MQRQSDDGFNEGAWIVGLIGMSFVVFYLTLRAIWWAIKLVAGCIIYVQAVIEQRRLSQRM